MDEPVTKVRIFHPVTAELIKQNENPGMRAYVLREFLKGVSDEYVRRPLWEFDPDERTAVLAERAKRWGVPNAEDDFDPEYH